MARVKMFSKKDRRFVNFPIVCTPSGDECKKCQALAELGSWQKCANSVLRTIGDIDTMTRNQIVNAIVGKVYEYSKKGEL